MQEILETTTAAASQAADSVTDKATFWLYVGILLLLAVLFIALIDWFAPRQPDPTCPYCGDGSDGREIHCCRVENRGKSYIRENENIVAKFCPVCGRKLSG